MSAELERIAGRWWPVVCNEEGDYWVRDDLAHQAEAVADRETGIDLRHWSLHPVDWVLMQPSPYEGGMPGDPDDGLSEVDPLEGPYEPQEVRRYMRFEEGPIPAPETRTETGA